MAAKKIITISVLLVALTSHLFAESPEPKRSKFHAFTHWVNTHKKVVAITAGTAAASGFAAWKLNQSNTPTPAPVHIVATPCPSSACITVAH